MSENPLGGIFHRLFAPSYRYFRLTYPRYDFTKVPCLERKFGKISTEGFKITDFEGGLYATSIVHDFDVNEVIRAYNGIKEWTAQHDNFMLDERPGHSVMFQVTLPDTYNLLGYRQVEYFFPIKFREE